MHKAVHPTFFKRSGVPLARALSHAPEYGTLCVRSGQKGARAKGFALHMNCRVRQCGNRCAWVIPLCSLAYAPSASAWDPIPDGPVIDACVMLAALGETANALPEEAGQARIEARRQVPEMARMRKDLRDLGASQGEIRSSTVTRRLTTLEELRKKDLITAEEYATKRREIMEGL